MIYISSACVSATKISEAVIKLNEAGFKNIELSGGTQPYPEMEADLIELKRKHQLNFLCHNYFPPPQKDFVLNLASLDDETAELSLQHCKKAIDLSQKLEADKFAFHAGFLINIPLNQIGKKIGKKALFDRKLALDRFSRHVDQLQHYAEGRVKLYIEDNVLSQENYQEFDKKNPFFFTHRENLKEINNKPVNILLDLAHLKVSCNSLDLDFKREAKDLLSQTDYIHLSENNGKKDQNLPLNHHSEIIELLRGKSLSNKTITLETYADLNSVRKSYELIQDLI